MVIAAGVRAARKAGTSRGIWQRLTTVFNTRVRPTC